MPDLGAISDAGGWAVAVFVLLGVIVAIYREILVPGHVYRLEVKRGDRLERANQRLARRVSAAELKAKGARRG